MSNNLSVGPQVNTLSILQTERWTEIRLCSPDGHFNPQASLWIPPAGGGEARSPVPPYTPPPAYANDPPPPYSNPADAPNNTASFQASILESGRSKTAEKSLSSNETNEQTHSRNGHGSLGEEALRPILPAIRPGPHNMIVKANRMVKNIFHSNGHYELSEPFNYTERGNLVDFYSRVSSNSNFKMDVYYLDIAKNAEVSTSAAINFKAVQKIECKGSLIAKTIEMEASKILLESCGDLSNDSKQVSYKKIPVVDFNDKNQNVMIEGSSKHLKVKIVAKNVIMGNFSAAEIVIDAVENIYKQGTVTVPSIKLRAEKGYCYV